MLKCSTVAIMFSLMLPDIAVADEELTVQSALAQRIIDPQLPLREVQAYVESRILPMPEPDSVDEWETYVNGVRQEVLDKVRASLARGTRRGSRHRRWYRAERSSPDASMPAAGRGRG